MSVDRSYLYIHDILIGLMRQVALDTVEDKVLPAVVALEVGPPVCVFLIILGMGWGRGSALGEPGGRAD